ncbi:DEG1 [Candida oxycetoniae]|uniref:DEG1 n=1 Tax=Candida oxycetoniae TaxID=497107 RepID=A0AAI9SUI6_9ASCO|nr:DEG1 [Candida oxycetoniae]KAI3403328.2 DEG1 [Candida oxycetoniae]
MSSTSSSSSSSSNTSSSTSDQALDYSSWSKEELIIKIKDLEQKAQGSNGKSDMDIPHTRPNLKKRKEFDWSKQNFRFVAIKFAYLGWNYNGLAYQAEPTQLPTVEETILKTLSKVKYIPEPIEEVDFARCGRTDKGVSAMNQVISIKLRSNLTAEEQLDAANDSREVDYLAVINHNLPPDIVAHAICLRPPENFDARFSCKNRHYRYLFKKTLNLDIGLMSQAAQYYLGAHDFRNFCKLDGSKQITNFERFISRSEIIPLGDDWYCFNLIGTAFLWHQVRCMVAMLFLVGQKLEDPSIIKDLLNMTKYPTKPQYEMANEIPLVLYDCQFPEMEWKRLDCANHFNKFLSKFRGMHYNLAVKAQMSSIMESVLFGPTTTIDQATTAKTIPLGDGIGRSFANYIPLADRQRSENYEILNARWMQRKGHKRQQQREIKSD